MKFPLPVLTTNSRNKITSLQYDTAVQALAHVFQTYDPCAIDSDGVCRKYRDSYDREQKLGYRTCCDHSSLGTCAHLGPQGCTTNNLACSQFFCPTATDHLQQVCPPARFAQIQQLQKDIVRLFEKNGSTISSNYFFSEEILKKKVVAG